MQKALKIKNVARYLAIHAKQMQLAKHFYMQVQAKSTKHTANYLAFANSNAQAISAKHATNVVANANALNTLIIAQCLNNSNTFNNAQADLQYILQTHALINS